MMEKDFAVDGVSWYLNVKGSTATFEEVRLRFEALVEFLEKNDLTKHALLKDGEKITENFEIRASSLTDEAMRVLRKGHAKWLNGIDRGKDPRDVKILMKELEKVRNSG